MDKIQSNVNISHSNFKIVLIIQLGVLNNYMTTFLERFLRLLV